MYRWAGLAKNGAVVGWCQAIDHREAMMVASATWRGVARVQSEASLRISEEEAKAVERPRRAATDAVA